MQEFTEFIEDMDVVDLSRFRNKFTCFNMVGDSMSRLDSFLISEGFTNKLGRKCQSIDNRNISDHCPISIKSSKFNWGPKSFKIFMAWIEHPNFLPLVE